jgi:UDP-3-O-[3-hydroxymyristoyl] glucosamine N-acyltransferase
MADPRFFPEPSAKTLDELAKATGSKLSDPSSGLMEVADVAPLNAAGEGDVSFLDNVKYKQDFHQTGAGAVFARPDMVDEAPENCVILINDDPYRAYAVAAAAMYDGMMGNDNPGISDQAIVADTAKIGDHVTIAPGTVIEDQVEIGDGSIIGPNTTIQQGCVIGKQCQIDANVTISFAIIGDKVDIYHGTRIGQRGYGYAMGPKGHLPVPQLGRVIIGNDVHIGANCTIDRGSGPDTTIGDGTRIDNLVQIAHNVTIGRGCIIVSQVGISGSSELEDFVVLAGQVGLAGHLTVGMGAQVAAQSGVLSDLPGGGEYMGSPAVPVKQFYKQCGILGRLAKGKTVRGIND